MNSALNSPVVASLAEIMSEQLASNLQSKEEEKYVKEALLPEAIEAGPVVFDASFLEGISSHSEDCKSDFMIAQMLQLQFSREHDEGVKRVEQKYNGKSKGKHQNGIFNQKLISKQ